MCMCMCASKCIYIYVCVYMYVCVCMNEELELINWEIFLDHHEPEIAWQNFK